MTRKVATSDVQKFSRCRHYNDRLAAASERRLKISAVSGQHITQEVRFLVKVATNLA